MSNRIPDIRKCQLFVVDLQSSAKLFLQSCLLTKRNLGYTITHIKVVYTTIARTTNILSPEELVLKAFNNTMLNFLRKPERKTITLWTYSILE